MALINFILFPYIHFADILYFRISNWLSGLTQLWDFFACIVDVIGFCLFLRFVFACLVDVIIVFCIFFRFVFGHVYVPYKRNTVKSVCEAVQC